MESPRTPTDLRSRTDKSDSIDDLTTLRLEKLLAENASHAANKERSLTAEQEMAEALIRNPIDSKRTFAQLGLLTGAIPTTAIFVKLIANSNPGEAGAMALATALMIAMSITATSAAGFYSGKFVGRIVSDLEQKHWITMLAALPFVGASWGLLCGAAGGIFLFGVGALVGGVVGGLVGTLVLFVFGILHRMLKDGESMERNRFIPIALGITGAVAAFILGL